MWDGPILSLNNNPAARNPSLPPGLYRIFVYVRTFANNVLIAEGHGASQSDPNTPYFYRSYFVVQFPPGACPIATIPADPTQAFSWATNPITPENVSSFTGTLDGQNLFVGAIPEANCPIAGYNIRDIVTLEQLRVRKINVSCKNCHQGLFELAVTVPPADPTPARKGFLCLYLLSLFPHTQYPDYGAQAEDTLFQLFTNWWSRGCPD
jgi:hypothetical protein